MVEVETVTTAEAAVRKGAMVQTPTPPTKMGRQFGAEARTVGKEVGQRRKTMDWGMGKRYS